MPTEFVLVPIECSVMIFQHVCQCLFNVSVNWAVSLSSILLLNIFSGILTIKPGKIIWWLMWRKEHQNLLHLWFGWNLMICLQVVKEYFVRCMVSAKQTINHHCIVLEWPHCLCQELWSCWKWKFTEFCHVVYCEYWVFQKKWSTLWWTYQSSWFCKFDNRIGSPASRSVVYSFRLIAYFAV